MTKTSYRLWLCTGGIVAAGLAMPARGAVTLTGQLSDVSFGAPLATQTINTGFGDSTVGDGTSTGGSEMDAAYATVQNGNLYVFIAGNYENNGNHVDLFINDGSAGGQNVLSAAADGALPGADGATFSPGFNATFALDSNDSGNTLYTDQYDFVKNEGNYLGSISLVNTTTGTATVTGIGSNQNLQNTGIAIGFNNTNAAGVNGVTGTAADPTAANAVTTGIDFGIPLSLLGNPTGKIELMALVNGGGDTYASNQALPGLPVGTGNLGDGTEAYSLAGTPGAFNFTTLPNEFFTVSVPTTLSNGTWLPTGNGSWGTAANWANGAIPGNPGDLASFSSATADAMVTLDGNRTIGTLEFSNTNSYTIAQGTSGSLIFNNSGKDALITDFGGSHTISAPLVLNSTVDIGVVNHGDFLTISGNISGTGGLNISNLGTGGSLANSAVILSGSNSYTGPTNVLRGTLQLGSSTALPSGASITLNASDAPAGELDLNNFNATLSSITVNGSFQPANIIDGSSSSGNSTLTYAGTSANPSDFTGNISDNSGAGGGVLGITVASGTLTLSGTNSYAGATTINSGGDLVLLSATASGSSFPFGGNITNNGSLEISDNNLAATITGTGATTVDAGMTLTAVGINQGELINNGAVQIVSTSSTTGPITGTGILAIDAPELAIAPGSARSQQSALSIGSGSTLELNNNIFTINYGAGNPSPLSDIQSDIASGAIASSPPAKGFGFGIDDNGSSVAFGDTLIGDVNVDGTVNLTDLLALLNFYGQNGKDWAQGDTNADGSVNLTDLLALLNNYGQSDRTTSFGSSATGTQVVPEPATMSLLAIGGSLLAIPRRKRRR